MSREEDRRADMLSSQCGLRTLAAVEHCARELMSAVTSDELWLLALLKNADIDRSYLQPAINLLVERKILRSVHAEQSFRHCTFSRETNGTPDDSDSRSRDR